MIESTEWLNAEIKKVEIWEKDQSDLWFWERLGRMPFRFIDKWTPAFIQNKIGVLLDELGRYVQTGGSYMSSVSKVSSFYPNMGVQTIEDVQQISISKMDNTVTSLSKNRKNIATLQGAGTGIGGIFTLSIDIPLLLGLQLKTLQDIAICYGYDPTDKKERLFIIKCLQFVSADIVGKKAVLSQLATFDEPDATGKREVLSEIQGWREVVFSYREQFGWKKLFQMVPVAGLFFGAFINRSALNDIAETAMMLYRKRRMLERLKKVTVE